MSGGDLSSAAGGTAPPPSSVEGQRAVWRCSLDTNASTFIVMSDGSRTASPVPRNGYTCAAAAVAAKPGLENRRLFYLFVLAGLLALGLQIAYDGARRLLRGTPG